jgi:hypothetical protein
MHENEHKFITLNEIRARLILIYPELRPLSRSTIQKYLKNYLLMSYKKFNKRPLCADKKEN